MSIDKHALADAFCSIAERAGLSPRSLFRYFDDADDLPVGRLAVHAHLARGMAVADADPGFRNHFGQLVGCLVDGAYFVVQIEHLAAAHQLAGYRLFDDVAALLLDKGVDRQPFCGRGGDDGEVPLLGVDAGAQPGTRIG